MSDGAARAAAGTGGAVWGVLAELRTPEELIDAASAVREEGYRSFDAHSPFPVHGIERAMGLSRSLVPWFVLVLGLGGAAAGMLLQWWVSAEAYPLVISGKPLFSWPAFVPIMFECGVLGGALGAIGGFLAMARLPRHHHPLFASSRFERMGDDRFFLSIEASDPAFDPRGTRDFLAGLGASHVETIFVPGTGEGAAKGGAGGAGEIETSAGGGGEIETSGAGEIEKSAGDENEERG